MIWTSSYSSCANPHVYSFVDICCSCLVAQAPKCSWFNHPPYFWPRPLHFHPHKILPNLQSGAHAKDRNCTLPRLNRSQSWKHRQPNLKAITRNDSKWFQMFPKNNLKPFELHKIQESPCENQPDQRLHQELRHLWAPCLSHGTLPRFQYFQWGILV